MPALRKVGFDEVVPGEEVVVYGKLRRANSNTRGIFTGNVGIVFRKAPPRPPVVTKLMALEAEPQGVWVRFPDDAYAMYKAFDGHLFKREEVKAPADATNKVEAGLAEIKDVFAYWRKNGTRKPESVFTTQGGGKRDGWGPVGVTQIAFVDGDGSVIWHTNTACHAGMRGAQGVVKSPVYIVSYLMRHDDKGLTEAEISYLDWLFNRSPWKDCFTTKSPKEAWDTGIVMDCNNPSNVLASGAIATRVVSEHRHVAKTWGALVEAGMGEDVAFLMAHIFCVKVEELYTRITTGHTALCISMLDADMYKNFIFNNPRRDSLYSEERSYGNLDGSWGGGKNAHGNLYNEVQELFQQFSQGFHGSKNIFGACKAVKLAVLPEFVAFLIPKIEESLK